MVVLGAIKVSNLKDVVKSDGSFSGYCFKVNDKELDEWNLCAPDAK